MGNFREAATTKVTPSDMLEALGRAWIASPSLVAEPSRKSVAVLIAQWAVETGWGRSMKNFNVAGIKCPDITSRWDWTMYPTREGYGPTAVTLVPPNPGCRFRAYATLADGCADYLDLLQHRFAKAWPAVEAGTPAAFGHALKMQGYYTGSEPSYDGELTSIYGTVMKLPPAQWEIDAALPPVPPSA